MYDKLDKFHDPRQASKITYPLSDLLLISLFAICQGAETWRQIVIWAETHQYWLRDYIDTSLGVPSYSTIRRIFTLIKPEQFQCLLDEILDFHGSNKQTEDHIAVVRITISFDHLIPFLAITQYHEVRSLNTIHSIT